MFLGAFFTKTIGRRVMLGTRVQGARSVRTACREDSEEGEKFLAADSGDLAADRVAADRG